jgi:hypothetical protein
MTIGDLLPFRGGHESETAAEELFARADAEAMFNLTNTVGANFSAAVLREGAIRPMSGVVPAHTVEGMKAAQHMDHTAEEILTGQSAGATAVSETVDEDTLGLRNELTEADQYDYANNVSGIPGDVSQVAVRSQVNIDPAVQQLAQQGYTQQDFTLARGE